LPALFAAAILCCCSGKTTPANKTPADNFTANCVQRPEGNIKWTFEECGPIYDGDTVLIETPTMGSAPSGGKFNPQPLGDRTLNKGRVTFTITNLDYSDLPWPTNDIVLVVFMGKGENGGEVNWHILGNRFASDGNVETRLVSQRFDGVCVPEEIRKCEKKHHDYDMPAYHRDRSFKFDCSWDTTAASLLYDQGPNIRDGLITCRIFNVTDPAKEILVQTYRTPTSGPYPTLNYFVAGGNASNGFRMKNTPTTLTNFRFTLFQD